MFGSCTKLGMGHSKYPEIEGYIEIPAQQIKLTNDLYVIGDSTVRPVPDLPFTHSNVYLRQKLQPSAATLSSYFMIPNGNKVPQAIALFRIPNTEAVKFHNSFQLGKKKHFVKADQVIVTYIKKYIVDMVVYSRRAAYDRCSVFEDLVPELSGISSGRTVCVFVALTIERDTGFSD